MKSFVTLSRFSLSEPNQIFTKLSLKCIFSSKNNNHKNRTVEYWVIRPFVAHILNANWTFTWFSHGYHHQIWIKLKWDHMRSTSFRIKKESSKSVHPVKSSEVTNIEKKLIELITFVFLKSVKKYRYVLIKVCGKSSF